MQVRAALYPVGKQRSTGAWFGRERQYVPSYSTWSLYSASTATRKLRTAGTYVAGDQRGPNLAPRMDSAPCGTDGTTGPALHVEWVGAGGWLKPTGLLAIGVARGAAPDAPAPAPTPNPPPQPAPPPRTPPATTTLLPTHPTVLPTPAPTRTPRRTTSSTTTRQTWTCPHPHPPPTRTLARTHTHAHTHAHLPHPPIANPVETAPGQAKLRDLLRAFRRPRPRGYRIHPGRNTHLVALPHDRVAQWARGPQSWRKAFATSGP
ncbi:hypothetical protein B0H12DRAFT_1236552 [Mycena haematopus]|nr:hypothetical protein B0H12DRAFT_1236552 [Mycena haematopus]